MAENRSTPSRPHRLTPDQMRTWDEQGYLIVPGLFRAEQVVAIRERFDAIAERGEPIPHHWQCEPGDDPMKRYPRLMHPHRFDALSKQWMLEPAVHEVLRDLFGEDAVACQSMYYFKPPKSAGQSLHQDNFYLAVQPGTCVGAWTAIDAADSDNGGMYLVPGSHRLGVICPDPERFRHKNGSNLVDPPKGMKALPAEMQPGDTLFFTGSVIHGSGSNRSDTRWRRSFICHYMPARSTHVHEGYFPIFDFAGNEISYEAASDGGPCGEAIKQYGNTYGVDALIH
ncbi:MAG: phytanoyl-CoA dioxygenase family protein [Phycisphaeraceae bacterium]